MSELPELPPAPRNARALPADGAATAVREGRRRRRRAAGTGAGAGGLLALALAAGVALSGQPSPERDDSLRTATAPPVPTATARVGPTPEPAAPEDVEALSPLTPPDDRAVQPPQDRSVPPAGDRPSRNEPAGSEEPSAPPTDDSEPGDVRPRVRDEPRTYRSNGCGSDDGVMVNGSCYFAEVRGTARGGEPVELVHTFCAGPTNIAPITLGFDGGQEHEFVIHADTGQSQDIPDRSSAGTTIWTWSATVQIEGTAHTRAVSPGTCLEWSSPWSTVDQAGKPLSAGTYVLASKITTQDSNYAQVFHTRITVS